MKNYSEVYRKYLIIITHEKKDYFTVYGSNLEEAEEDNLLVNFEGQILLFESVEKLRNYVKKNGRTLFDEKNLYKWCQKIKVSEKEYAAFDLDSIRKILKVKNKISNQNMRDFFDLILLVEDFAYQVKDSKMIGLINNRSLIELKDKYYDRFLWKEQTMVEFDSKLFLQNKENYAKLIDLFSSKFLICNLL